MVDRIPSKINLEIVTPERQFFCGEVDVVYIPGREGYMGILPGHAPLLSELKTGVISYSSEGTEKRLFCSWGFAEVLADQVSILVEKAELPEDIDADQAKADKEKADTLLRSKSPDTDFPGALELWQASVARLEVLGV
jgi:F-type H+-transporting ATPase subunit epsilon